MTYVMLDANAVIEACEKFIASQARIRQTEQQYLIHQQMSKRWFRAKTEKEAIRRLSQDRFDDYGMAEFREQCATAPVKELQDAAILSLVHGDGRVAVSAGLASKLTGLMLR